MPEISDIAAPGRRQRWALAALFACCFLPFLVPVRTLPLPAFYAEWVALAAGLAALPILGAHPGLHVPRIAALPVGLFILLLLQLVWLPSAFRPAALIALLYLLWATLLMLATTALLRGIALCRLADWLALALFLAALFNAAKAFLLQAVPGWIFSFAERGGNLGQVNLFADLLWLGVVSLLYRWRRSERRGWMWAMGLLPLLAASAMTGGRAPMLYALWLTLAACIWGETRLRRAAAGTALLYFVFVVLVHWLSIHGVFLSIGSSSDSLSRTLADVRGSVGGIRLELMAMAGHIFLANPLFGAGWGSYAWESYNGAGDLGSVRAAAEHAHQFFFHVAAEMGVVGLIVASAAFLLWARPLWSERLSLRTSPEYWWAAAGAGVILLHAQLEFPLWNAHFLGVCAILAACAERRAIAFDKLRLSGATLALTIAVGAYLLLSSGRDYVRLEQWVARDMHRDGAPPPDGYYQLLVDLHQGSLLQAQAGRVLAAVMPPTADHLQGKLEICRRALQSEPQSPAVFTCALLKGLAGDTTADRDMRQAHLVFEKYWPEYLKALDASLTPSELASIRPRLESRALEPGGAR